MVRIFQISSDSEAEEMASPIINLPSDSDNDENAPTPAKQRRAVQPDGKNPEVGAPKGYWEKVREAAEELMMNGIQIGGGRVPKQKEPVDPASRNGGKVLDDRIFDGPGNRCLSAAWLKSQYIKAYRVAARVEMLEGFKQPYPDDALLAMVKKVVKYTENAAKMEGLKPNHFIVQVESRLLDTSIFVHLRSTTDAAIAELLVEFERIDQSNRKKGRDTIIEAPFIIDCNAIEAKKRTPAGKKRNHPGGGCRRQKRLQKQLKLKYNVHEGAFWEQITPISATLCLFQSIIIAAAYVLMKAQAFCRFKSTSSRQKLAVNRLLKWTKINPKLRRYAIEDYGDAIQAYYDHHHPGKIRIFAFKSVSSSYKPFWMSNANKYEKAVCIFYDVEDKHYVPLKLPGRLFGNGYLYCFACCCPYKDANKHKLTCLCKCLNCMRVGPNFPCSAEEGVEIKCAQCNKVFMNQACHEFHLKLRTYPGQNGNKVQSSVCTRSKKCPDCGRLYANGKGKRAHRCDETYCMRCRSYHQGRLCYMQYTPKSSKPIRYIAYDFETTPDLIPDTEFRFRHAVNFCQAYVWCSLCKENGNWDKPLDGFCEFCGDQRNYSWSSFPLCDEWLPNTKHTQVNEDDDILPRFVDWLLNFERDILHITERRRKYGKNKKDVDEGKECEEVAEEEEENDENEIVQMDLIEEMEEEEQNGKKGKRAQSFVYAHCGSRYDHVITFSEILKKKGLPVSKPIRRGNKLMQFEVKKTDIITHILFRDSYNIISIPLDSFVKTFDLQIPGIPGKMHFPHNWNRPENYYTNLDHLPDLDYYSPGTKNARAKKELEEWYGTNRDQPFCLKDVLAKYCFFDVLILVHGIVKMQELYQETSGLDITRYLTMPSACVAHFLKTLEKEVVGADGTKTIKRTKVAIVPEMGYERRENTSGIATKFLKWIAYKNPEWDVEHAQTEAGEVRVCGNRYAVDGYVRRPGERDLAIEIYGCFWHGCPIHFPDDEQCGYGRPASSIRKRDAKREAEIRASGIDLQIYWECKITDKLEMDPMEYEGELLEDGEENVAEKVEELKEMQLFMETVVDNGPIEISDAFFGGRTGPEWMSEVAKDGYCMKYLDVNSLYPKINFSTRYPIAHPTTKFWPELPVNWTSPTEMLDPDTGKPLEGIIKGFIVPPPHPKWGIPVNPLRVGKRLLFLLCRTCAQKYPKGCVKPGYQCPHESDDERGFVFTLSHPELGRALEAGYRVTKLFRAYLWEKAEDWSDNLFVDYIQLWYAHKYHASGWPANCTDETISEKERKRNKEELFNEAWDRYGIRLEAAKMNFNPGMRFLAKQALNSLWGRLALRNRLTKTVVTDDVCEINRYLNNRSIRISMLDQVSEHYWMIGYETKREATLEHPTSNPIIALWTTSLARCHLLDQLRGVYQDQRRMVEQPEMFPNGIFRADARILYMDTDSIIYRFRKALGNPLLEGEHLGELKDEYPNHNIKEFWCLAPKAYALLLADKNGKEEHVVKTRAITMDYDTAQKVNLDRVREMVIDMYNTDKEKNYEEVRVNNNFRAGRAGGITTVPMTKKFGPTLNKGILRENYQLVPYGFKLCPICTEKGFSQCICMFSLTPTILK